jgi:hypothetical protein
LKQRSEVCEVTGEDDRPAVGQLLQPLSVRAMAGYHEERRRRKMVDGLDRQVNALRSVES